MITAEFARVHLAVVRRWLATDPAVQEAAVRMIQSFPPAAAVESPPFSQAGAAAARTGARRRRSMPRPAASEVR